MSPNAATLSSLSAAMDGGFTAIHDVSRALSAVGAAEDYRLIGGVSVMLHVQRLGLDLPYAQPATPTSEYRRMCSAGPTSSKRSKRSGMQRCSATVGSDASTIDGWLQSTS